MSIDTTTDIRLLYPAHPVSGQPSCMHRDWLHDPQVSRIRQIVVLPTRSCIMIRHDKRPFPFHGHLFGHCVQREVHGPQTKVLWGRESPKLPKCIPTGRKPAAAAGPGAARPPPGAACPPPTAARVRLRFTGPWGCHLGSIPGSMAGSSRTRGRARIPAIEVTLPRWARCGTDNPGPPAEQLCLIQKATTVPRCWLHTSAV